ncbi:protein AATF [Kryptolebias marmoratus]|uniref:Apoptosis antagonizing transcription factor n=1 Tax=Kryptolebias marmoratus TaxID=37003 RepID=A0A3Q3BFZ0_KRYMA|nr:protein AATF [Kryptolebias marmoratus]
MAACSFSQELEDLLNPLPKFADPEDDADEATKARVTEGFEEGEEEEEGPTRGALRNRNSALLSDTDRRYVGKPVSRKQLLMDTEGSDEEEEDGDSDDNVEADEVVENEDDYSVEEEQECLDSESKLTSKSSDITFPKNLDFHKMTEGMDDLGVSDDDDDNDGSGEEFEGSHDEDQSSEMDDGLDEVTIRTFSQVKVDEEVEKGRAVQNQLALWDQLLEGRIKLQKVLMTANQLPQPPTFPEFRRKGRVEFAGALKTSHKSLKALQRSLLELQDQLLYLNPDTRTITAGQQQSEGEDEEVRSDEEQSVKEAGVPKRKLDMTEYPDFMLKRFAAFKPFCDSTLQRWHDKTRLTQGKSSRGFGAFDRNILTQVEQVLMDEERLVQRTQTRRSEYNVLGKREAPAVVPENVLTDGEQQLKANTHLKDMDEDIFDDDDFYHQLLRELIERRTSAADPNDQVAMGRQWLAIQKLRSKIKKKVDTKASKGRKVRFHVHNKLLNFMAPIDHSSMSDEGRSELYRGLFGQNSSIRK